MVGREDARDNPAATGSTPATNPGGYSAADEQQLPAAVPGAATNGTHSRTKRMSRVRVR